MLTLAQFNLPTLIVALLIGVATGWWMFRRPAAAADDSAGPTEEESQTP